jgi:hypothetical protein
VGLQAVSPVTEHPGSELIRIPSSARIVARPQNAYGSERCVYVDEKLSFNPRHYPVAHRPLGNIIALNVTRARIDQIRWPLTL